MRVLITSFRMPFALDPIRKLGEGGHEVFACDSYAASPGDTGRLAGHLSLPRSIDDLARTPESDRGWHDAMPERYSFLALARFEKLSFRRREQLLAAMADGITWDGQSIPGLPPEDATYLAKLAGEPA